MNDNRPTHIYIARKPCGCCVGIIGAKSDKGTGHAVGEWIAGGLTIDRVSFDDYKNNICNEETFMSCIHGQLTLLPARGGAR